MEPQKQASAETTNVLVCGRGQEADSQTLDHTVNPWMKAFSSQ